jgi:hypothetical protein
MVTAELQDDIRPASPLPAWLVTPPTVLVNPPVVTRQQELPFAELSWKNLERLCLRLAEKEARVEHCQLYGVPGQAQDGIDLFARESFNSKYRVYQCKNEARFSAAKITDAVNEFLNGAWPDKTDTFVLCIRESLEPTDRAVEFERQAERLRNRGIKLVAWDSSQLSRMLKEVPELVDDFFGRGWVEAFCGREKAQGLGDRLDAEQVTAFRAQMGQLYRHVFTAQDPGLLISDAPGAALSLEERFVVPDIYERRAVKLSVPGTSHSNGHVVRDGSAEADYGRSSLVSSSEERPKDFSAILKTRRAIDDWIAANQYSVLMGGPGSGKSTALRILAIDLLREEPRLTPIARKWGTYLPVWIPFPVWTKLIVERGSSASLTDVMEVWLSGWAQRGLWPLVVKALADKRVLLLVDGIDEWTNEEAAGIAVNKLRVFINQHSVPAVMASRPHGFERLGLEETGWEVAELADFTPAQQRGVARIWHVCRLRQLDGDPLSPEEIDWRAEAASSEFVEELGRSKDFQELAGVPLLLCLLVLRRMHDGYLPTSRFKAYEQLVELLTVKHPALRRKAAEIVSSSSLILSDTENKQILAFLAYHIQTQHPDGLIDRIEAERVVRDYLKDTSNGFCFAERDARLHAGRLVNIGIETIGVLVNRSQTDLGFFHRIVQEYLAACHLASQSLEEQLGVVETKGGDPQWREVLLSLFSMTPRSGDIRAFVEAIRTKAAHPFDRLYADELTTEVACGAFNSPNDLAREISNSAFEQIESDSWMPQRERLLQCVLEGLRSARLRGTMQDQIGRWFPCTLLGREVIFGAMAEWPQEPEVIDCLIKGMQDEDVAVQRSAGQALARLASMNRAVGDRVADIARHSGNALARAAALTSLSRGWPDHPNTAQAVKSARQSACPELRLAAIVVLIRRGEHTEEDLNELVRLGSWHWNVDGQWQPEVVESLVQGWARTDALKERCLNYAHSAYGRSDVLEEDTALAVLLRAFPGDERVANHFAQYIRHTDHPFILFDHIDPWKRLAANFPNHPDLNAAIEEWFKRPHHLEPTIAAAALVGRTVESKQRLLTQLATSSVPFWASGSLLEGWGMGDPDVAAALGTMAFGDAGKASLIAADLPEIIEDRERCRQRLLEILRDPGCERPDMILDGLRTLGTQGDVEAAENVLAVLEQRPEWKSHPLWAMNARVITLYPWDERVREMAKQALSSTEGHHPSVARAYGTDVEIRRAILRRVNPLPGSLREYLARNVSPSIGPSDFVLETLTSCYVDPNGNVKTEAAITCCSALKSSGNVPEAVIDKLRAEIVHEHDVEYWLRRQAAFAGLIILGRLDVYSGPNECGPADPLLAPDVYRLQENPAFVRVLMEHWEEIGPRKDRIALGVKNWHDFWEVACAQADEFPAARAEALKSFEENPEARPSANELRFLSRAVPGGPLLLDKCLKALHIGNDRSIDLGWETLAAAEILGKQFGHDEGVYQRIIGECDGPWVPYCAVLALCEGWPESEVLARYQGDLSLDHVRNLFTSIVTIRFLCLKDSAEGVWTMLNRLLSNRRPKDFSEATYAPVVRRFRTDDRLFEIASAELRNQPSPTVKASLARILISARGTTPDLKAWCLDELEKQTTREHVSEIGFDIAEGAYRPVEYALLDALNTGSGIRRYG